MKLTNTLWGGLSAGILAASIVLPIPVAMANNAPGPAGNCHDLSIPVSLQDGGANNLHLAATLCKPYGIATNTKDVDVLVHGASYTRDYWNFATDYPTYSYVNRTLLSGRAVLYFDQIGAGASSYPPSNLITLDAAAHTAHQAIDWTKSQGYKSVTLVGHSMGSATAIREAATYHDVDRLVLTSSLHRSATVDLSKIYPANLDPAFTGKGLDDGYLTTTPGSRGAMFDDLATADPAVIARDEATKSTFSVTFLLDDISDALTPAANNVSQGVTAPVLIEIGQQDNLFCLPPNQACTYAGVGATEAPYFTHAKSFLAVTIPKTGHDLTLHPSAGLSYAAIELWILTH